MIPASKNIAVGDPITDFRQIRKLAKEKRSIVEWRITETDNELRVKPAAFYLNWPLSKILKTHFFKSVKQ